MQELWNQINHALRAHLSRNMPDVRAHVTKIATDLINEKMGKLIPELVNKRFEISGEYFGIAGAAVTKALTGKKGQTEDAKAQLREYADASIKRYLALITQDQIDTLVAAEIKKRFK